MPHPVGGAMGVTLSRADMENPGVMKMYTPRKYGHPGVPIFM